MPCVFCQIASGEVKADVVRTFNQVFVLQDKYPVTRGHLLIIPKQHILEWFTAPLAVRHEIVEVLDLMKKYLDDTYHPDGYNIGANCGPVAGQTVMHLHMHLIPRYAGDMEDPSGGVRGVIPSKQKYV